MITILTLIIVMLKDYLFNIVYFLLNFGRIILCLVIFNIIC